MSKKIHDIYIKKGEKISAYDKRINDMLPVHAGYAYFDANIYDSRRNMLGTYIVWNGVINSAMLNPLTEQGYILECQENVAACICRFGKALPVYIKLYSYKGKLQTKRVFIVFSDDEYEMAYTGMSVKAPEQIFFKDVVMVESGSYNLEAVKVESSFDGNSASSYNLAGFDANSFNLSSFNISSFNISSFNLNIFNISSFNISSFNTFGLSNSFNISSFNAFWMNNSFNVSSFNTFWLSAGSFINTSFNMDICKGSFSVSGSAMSVWNYNFVLPDDTDNHEVNDGELASKEVEDYLFKQFYEVYGIGCLGYGLNLI